MKYERFQYNYFTIHRDISKPYSVLKDFSSMDASSTTVSRFVAIQVNSRKLQTSSLQKAVSCRTSLTCSEKRKKICADWDFIPESHIGIHFTKLRRFMLTLGGDG